MSRPVKPRAGPVSRVQRNPTLDEEEKRFSGLRRRLNDEGYAEAFGNDSSPLVERLLDDLQALKQTHGTLSSRFEELSANEQRLQRSIHPVQKELGRMVRENNQLHLELIEHGEQAEASQRRIDIETKKLKTKIADQGFIISQQSQHIRELERSIESQKDRIADLLSSNFTCTVGPYGDIKPKGQQIMLTHSTSPKIQPPETDMGPQVVFNLEDQTTKQIDSLTSALKELRDAHAEVLSKNRSLEDSIKSREGEIARMGKLLEKNVNSDMEELERAKQDQDLVIKRLNDQLDIVSAQLADSEEHKGEMERFRREKPEIEAEIGALQAELAESKQVVMHLQGLVASQKPSSSALPGRGGAGQAKGPAAGDDSDGGAGGRGIGGGNNNSNNNKSSAERTSRDGAVDLATETLRMAAQADQEALEDALEKLSNAEDEVYRLQGVVDEREEENRTLHGDVTRLNKTLAVLEEERAGEIKSLGGEMERLMGELGKLSQTREETDSLREELEAYKAWVKELEARANSPQIAQGFLKDFEEIKTQTQGLFADKKELISELEGLMQACEDKDAVIKEERDAKEYMAEVIKGFEAQMENVQGTIMSLTQGWEGKEQGYVKAYAQLEERYKEAAAGGGGGDKALRELREELALVEQGNRLTNTQLQNKLNETKERCLELEDKATKAERRCKERERAISELQSLLASMDGSRGEVENQLRAFMSSDEGGRRRMVQLEEEVERLKVEARRKEEERDRALETVQAVDRERDSALSQLEAKAGEAKRLEEQLRGEHQLRQQRESAAMVSQQQADMLREATGDYDAQVGSLQRQLTAEGEMRGRLQQLCEAREEEIHALTADLSAMTRENQVVNSELAEIVGQRDALKADFDGTLERLMVAEQLLQGKESERDEVLMSYRSLYEEKGRIEANYERSLAEVHEVKGALYTRDEELLRSAETIRNLEQESHRVSLDLQSMQRHSQALADRIVQLEGSLKQAVADASQQRQETHASSGALAVMERSKQEVIRESALLRDEIVALRNKASAQSAERDVLMGRYEAERTRAKDLEDVLQALRAKEHSATLAEKGLSNEASSLRDQLHKAVSDRDRLAEELRVASARRDEAQYELSKVKRHVSVDGAERDTLAGEVSHLRTKVQELQLVIDQQTSSLESKDREAMQLRTRLSKLQVEAEENERKVIELEGKIRRNDEVVAGLHASSRTQVHTVAAHEQETMQIRSRLREAEEDLSKTKSELRMERETLSSVQASVSVLQNQTTDCKADKERLRAQLEQAQTQVKIAREDAAESSELLEKLDGDYRMMQSKYLALLEGQRGANRTMDDSIGSPPR